MILGILLGESYSSIRALVDLSVHVKYTNTLKTNYTKKLSYTKNVNTLDG